ncbi:MAG: sulfotransferase family 2 domain-containing protein [Microcystaceae cyanobacterium]
MKRTPKFKNASQWQKKVTRYLALLQGRQIANFIHIGKTVGTAVKHTLQNHLVTDRYIIQLRGHTCTLRDLPKGEKYFFILRDPVQRFVSGFYSRKRWEKEGVKSWPAKEAKAFKQFTTPNDLALALASDQIAIKEAAIQGMQHIGHVCTSYWDWFETEAYFLSRMEDVLYVGFQETLNQDFLNLKKLLHLPVELELPDNPEKSNRISQKFDKRLTNEAHKYLRLWYRRDYDFIEMCKQIWQEDRTEGMIPNANIKVRDHKARLAH